MGELELKIEEKIFTIRGKQVILDRDLARLYGVETKRLNEQVKRNLERFPDDFMFQLTVDECSRSQFATLNIQQGHNIKYMPYAFTEYGIAMLSGVLRSDTAVAANIKIMRAFADMRKLLPEIGSVTSRIAMLEYNQVAIKEQLTETADKVDILMSKIDKAMPESRKQGIFFDGQIYDAYAFVAGLVRRAVKRIALIDNYIYESVLTLLDKRGAGVHATVYTGNISKQLRLDINKHNAQYPPIEILIFNKAHDRFLIIDSEVYLIGASIKDLGKKWFGFTLMENTNADDLIGKI